MAKSMEAELPDDVRCRTLVSVSKRSFKRAVDRNRIKRLMREAWRLHKHTAYAAFQKHEKQRAMVEQLLDKAKEVMGDRLGDETYTFARLVQVIANEVDCFEDSKRYGNLSVGVGTYGTVSMGDDYGDYFVDGHLNIQNHVKGDWQE